MLDVEGAVVTADAMHAQRDAAERIIGKGGDYVLALKGSQGSLHKDAKAWLEDPGNAEKMLSHQQIGSGHGREETRTETRHYLLSRKMSPEDFLKAVRNRWAIENKLHWVLDVWMREDDLRNRAGRGPENLAAVRRLVVSIVHLMDDKLSIRRRLLRAAQVPDCRLELIANAAKLAEKL